MTSGRGPGEPSSLSRHPGTAQTTTLPRDRSAVRTDTGTIPSVHRAEPLRDPGAGIRPDPDRPTRSAPTVRPVDAVRAGSGRDHQPGLAAFVVDPWITRSRRPQRPPRQKEKPHEMEDMHSPRVRVSSALLASCLSIQSLQRPVAGRRPSTPGRSSGLSVKGVVDFKAAPPPTAPLRQLRCRPTGR